MQLLIIPVILTLGGLWFNQQRARTEREIASDRLRDAALQTYLDRMTELLLEKGLRTSDEKAEVRGVARAWTLTVLLRLDGTRKKELLRFLFESGLIYREKAVINLNGADFSEAELEKTFLPRTGLFGVNLALANLRQALLDQADLQGVHLFRANLQWADLRGAHLDGANLREANLRGAHLLGTTLTGTRLIEADLTGAKLINADLTGADLTAANLTGAYLDGAILEDAIITKKQLSKVKSFDDVVGENNLTHNES
jgi:uncharacterized protein YjbI with pentapeptide repeats